MDAWRGAQWTIITNTPPPEKFHKNERICSTADQFNAIPHPSAKTQALALLRGCPRPLFVHDLDLYDLIAGPQWFGHKGLGDGNKGGPNIKGCERDKEFMDKWMQELVRDANRKLPPLQQLLLISPTRWGWQRSPEHILVVSWLGPGKAECWATQPNCTPVAVRPFLRRQDAWSSSPPIPPGNQKTAVAMHCRSNQLRWMASQQSGHPWTGTIHR